jgi:pimeloyl-ACP methyl ester carboxylesterase
VFFGFRDYGSLRVFYPSLEETPQDAPILLSCGRYPLIMLVHGQCDQPEHYKDWHALPAQLARAGYVVAVREFNGIAGGAYPWEAEGDLQLLVDTVDWMRNRWQVLNFIIDPERLGVVGHSYGALLASRLPSRLNVNAYVSLSGVWHEWTPVSSWPLFSMSQPKLFVWGSGGLDFSAVIGGGTAWTSIPQPKHKADFATLAHWDYLEPNTTQCASDMGDCALSHVVNRDLVTMFFAKHLPPAQLLPDHIPDSLVPPPLALTPQQQVFATNYLTGFESIQGHSECRVTLSWELGAAGTGTEVRP